METTIHDTIRWIWLQICKKDTFDVYSNIKLKYVQYNYLSMIERLFSFDNRKYSQLKNIT